MLTSLSTLACFSTRHPPRCSYPSQTVGSYFVNAQWGLQSSIKEKGISSEAFETLGFDIPVPLFIPHIALLRSIPYFEELDLQGFAGALALS